MKKILILGGTKYVGKAFLNEMIANHNHKITVLSRHKIENIISIEGNRKDEALLLKMLNNEYDIIIDFICFCLPDAKKLIDAINKNSKNPKIIFISSTYVYDQNANQDLYYENDFNATNYSPSNSEREYITYKEGKRSAETYFTRNYDQNNLCIIRFPIILGKNDYTLRSDFFTNFYKNGGQLGQIKTAGKSNFIFVQDIVRVLTLLINNFKPGIFNLVRPEFFCQRDLAKMYLKILGYKESLKHNNTKISTPFYYKTNFKINGDKLSKIISFNNSFFSSLKYILNQ